jgi:hypothetical protein
MNKSALLSSLLVLSIGSLQAAPEQDAPKKIKKWDPTYTDKRQVVDWDSSQFRGFGKRNTSKLDGRKALGGKKTISPEEAKGPFSKRWETDDGRPRWLDKDFRTKEARIVAKARKDWRARVMEKDQARGFDREFQTRQSSLDAQTRNRLFQGEDRASGVMYSGPEAKTIRKELQDASDALSFENIEKDHKLTIEKIKEMLNKP